MNYKIRNGMVFVMADHGTKRQAKDTTQILRGEKNAEDGMIHGSIMLGNPPKPYRVIVDPRCCEQTTDFGCLPNGREFLDPSPTGVPSRRLVKLDGSYACDVVTGELVPVPSGCCVEVLNTMHDVRRFRAKRSVIAVMHNTNPVAVPVPV